MKRAAARRAVLVALTAAFGAALATGVAAGHPSAVAPVPGPAVAGDEDEGGERVRALQRELRSILPLRSWPGADWGVLVTSLERRDTLFAHDPHRTLAPASNVKLLTSAAALHHLGPDFRYRTFLVSEAPVEDGVLRGDLVLYGTGDPSFGSGSTRAGDRTLRDLARNLRERGIREVDGDVVGDGTYFPGDARPRGWSWRDLNDWFAAPVTGLTYNENVTTLHITPGPGPGAPLRVETIPEHTPIPLRVTGTTVAGRPGHAVWAVREDPRQAVKIVGELQTRSSGLWRRLTVNEPGLYAASRLRAVLEEEGIRVHGSAGTVRDPSASPVTDRTLSAPALSDGPRTTILAEHRSAPLVELLAVVNKRSHNLYAEAVLRTLGRVVGDDASFRGGTRVVHRFLVEKAGVPPPEVRPADGSGLSPSNQVSAYAFVAAMDFLARSPHRDAFFSTLPEAGNYRELSRMYRSPAAGNLRAKTGTIEGVSALSGMVRASSGERLLFSIVANDVPSTSAAKRVEDRIGIRLAEFWRPEDGAAADAVVAGRD